MDDGNCRLHRLFWQSPEEKSGLSDNCYSRENLVGDGIDPFLIQSMFGIASIISRFGSKACLNPEKPKVGIRLSHRYVDSPIDGLLSIVEDWHVNKSPQTQLRALHLIN